MKIHEREITPLGDSNNITDASSEQCPDCEINSVAQPGQASGSELLTDKQAASYMACSVRTIWKWKRAGDIACITHGRYTRFDRTALLIPV